MTVRALFSMGINVLGGIYIDFTYSYISRCALYVALSLYSRSIG